MANFVEHFLSRTSAAVGHIFKALPDGFMHIGAGNDIEKPLIGFRILNDCFRFALRREVVTEWMSFEMSNDSTFSGAV